jgi:hypothetical protein
MLFDLLALASRLDQALLKLLGLCVLGFIARHTRR